MPHQAEGNSAPVVVGRKADPHIEAVTSALREDFSCSPSFLGSEECTQWLWSAAGALTRDARLRRGWIRELPSVRDGLGQAEQQAWVDYACGLVSDPSIQWLTALSDIRQADNKLYQLRVAQMLGIPYPRTIVPRRVRDIAEIIGPFAVLKPLGDGVIRSEHATPRVFYSTRVSTDELNDAELNQAPVIAQAPLAASEHLRVVTVADRTWCATLEASNLPLDWRESAGAHHAWRHVSTPAEVGAAAREVANYCHLGFSSQDWIRDAHGYWFVDLNPNGKWLFLPETITREVTLSISRWLCSIS